MAKHQTIEATELEIIDGETIETAANPVAVSRPQAAPIAAPARPDTSPFALLQRAVETGAGMETIERLLALQERVEAGNARRAFDAAIADAKAEIGPIEKNRRVHFESQKGKTDYRFEDLAAIANAVDPVLSKNGLSYRYRTAQDKGQLRVTCVLSHRDGYSEETTLEAGYDNSGNKNSHQAVGSALTYLQRYTLKAALGLAVSHDDDGRAASKPANAAPELPAELTAKQAAELTTLVEETATDLALFLKAAKAASIADITPANFPGLRQRLLEKKAKAVKAAPEAPAIAAE